MKIEAAALIANLTGIPQKKIETTLNLKKKTLNEVLFSPGLIPGITQEQMRRMEALNEFSRVYSAAGHSYTLSSDSGQIARYLYGMIGGQRQENVVALLYDKKKELIRAEKMFKGGVSSAMIDPVVFAKAVVENKAKHVIIAHNHPSGDPSLSRDDRQTAAELRKQLLQFGCKLEGSYVIGQNTYCNEDLSAPQQIPQTHPEIVLFPNVQKDQDDRKMQDLLSSATGIRRSIVENWMGEGYALSEVMSEPKAPAYGISESDAEKITLATTIAHEAITEPQQVRRRISGPDDAATLSAEYAIKTGHAAGVLFMDIRHQVIDENEISWPLTTIGCNKIAREAYKNNAGHVLVYRAEDDASSRDAQADRASANRAYENFTALNIEMVDVLVLSKTRPWDYKSYKQMGELPIREESVAYPKETETHHEKQRRTRR